VVQLRILLLWNMVLCHWVVGTYFSRQIRALIFRGWKVASRQWDPVTHWHSTYIAAESSVPHLTVFSIFFPPYTPPKQICSNYACCQWQVCHIWSQFASFAPQGLGGICSIQRGPGAGFCLSTLVLLWQLHASHQFIIRDCYKEACF
jgi:hypothetical protein